MAAGYAWVPGQGWVRLSGSDLTLGTGYNQAARGDHTHTPTGLPDVGWTNVSFQNGWGNYGSGFETVQYRRLNGVVYIKGFMNASGTKTSGAKIFDLPVGFLPEADKHQPVLLEINPTSAARVRINRSNACVEVNSFPASGFGWVSFAGISYPADA